MPGHARDHGDRHSPGGPDPIPGLGSGGGATNYWEEVGGDLHPASLPDTLTAEADLDVSLFGGRDVFAYSQTGKIELTATTDFNTISSQDTSIQAGFNIDITPGVGGDMTIGNAGQNGNTTIQAAGGDIRTATQGGEISFSTTGGHIRLDSGGQIIMVALPTSDPGVSGALWNSAGTLKISP